MVFKWRVDWRVLWDSFFYGSIFSISISVLFTWDFKRAGRVKSGRNKASERFTAPWNGENMLSSEFSDIICTISAERSHSIVILGQREMQRLHSFSKTWARERGLSEKVRERRVTNTSMRIMKNTFLLYYEKHCFWHSIPTWFQTDPAQSTPSKWMLYIPSHQSNRL